MRHAPAPSEPDAPADVSEAEFLARYDPGDFARPSVAVDVVVLTVVGDRLGVALYPRAEHPHRGHFALPGGFVGIDEGLDEAASRLLERKAGLTGVYFEQLHTFGAPGRDPRMRIITVAYYALVHPTRLADLHTDGGALIAQVEVPWEGEAGGSVRVRAPGGDELPLAFDHAEIVGAAVRRLRERLARTAVGFELVEPEFTLRQLQTVHEAIRGEPVNRDAFRRRMLTSGQLEPTGTREQAVEHRPAELFRRR